MVGDNTNIDEHLLPDRHPQHDLFICDVADAVLKDVMQQMEHPFYSLSKKPETTVRRYEHNGNWLEITPSVKGLATIYDKDILIYCISQIMHKLNKGEKVSQRVRINSRELLIFTNRGTSGRDYIALVEALDRLEGTRIRTNIITGDEEQIDGFGLIDASSIRRKHGMDGRLLWCEVKLSDWVFNAIRTKSVLTLHRDYFRLRKPIQRRMYELARKHCGSQSSAIIDLQTLHKKSGSKSSEKEFRRAVREIAKSNHLPDYALRFDSDRDSVTFTNRGTMLPREQSAQQALIFLKADTYDEARQAAPSWDVHYLEQEWRNWIKEPPKHPDRAFIGFCRKWYEKRGRA
ncbi:replication initiator protein A [Aerobium aerolatum]|uniref:Plasmid replication initiator protein n=1 Tax=Aquamicrobium aerolatum DSM 21857 TaxID=1121003 RepID=A0A1I3SXW6_9HYPH|nr:replication initiator protein A [Aquamicrobium aerolatum]SFJ62266.1 Plasmid replication initiator protein [Aquamicrobium aerolatum DSM 21857]